MEFKIYTSYHAKKNAIENMGLVPVNISLHAPRWEKYQYHCRALAPTKEILALEEPEYTPKFKLLLSKLSASDIFSTLKKMGDGKDVVLTCYEKVGCFCHRHLVAEWLSQELNIEVKELEFPKPKDLFSM